MSKPKKGNKSHHNKGYSFNEALLQYNVKNYTGTLTRLKTASLKPNEVERAEQLKQATLLRMAYSDFSAYQYDQALQRLQLLPADNLIAQALTGITYLYQNEYEKAVPVFKKLIQQPDYQNFTIYYLLAELYIGQPEKYDDFKNWHAPLFAQCTAFQQDYLHVAFYIVHQQFDHALNLVKLTKGASHAQHSHIEALKQVLSMGQGKSEGQIAPTTKALYRLLLNYPLQDFEAVYFSAKQAESPLFVDIFKQQSSLTPELIQELKKVCETD
jgi:tetratricopeptide (TPR) repeat protein